MLAKLGPNLRKLTLSTKSPSSAQCGPVQSKNRYFSSVEESNSGQRRYAKTLHSLINKSAGCTDLATSIKGTTESSNSLLSSRPLAFSHLLHKPAFGTYYTNEIIRGLHLKRLSAHLHKDALHHSQLRRRLPRWPSQTDHLDILIANAEVIGYSSRPDQGWYDMLFGICRLGNVLVVKLPMATQLKAANLPASGVCIVCRASVGFSGHSAVWH